MHHWKYDSSLVAGAVEYFSEYQNHRVEELYLWYTVVRCDTEEGDVGVSLSSPLCCHLSCYHGERLHSPLVGFRGRSWVSLALGRVSSSIRPFCHL